MILFIHFYFIIFLILCCHGDVRCHGSGWVEYPMDASQFSQKITHTRKPQICFLISTFTVMFAQIKYASDCHLPVCLKNA